ncbi:MAG: pyruvate carboxylase subunit B [Desulfobacteraceae bacterium]|nr:MAG: pyruvate carboxylase subunit B [Desulfobacteraceae bacterium]
MTELGFIEETLRDGQQSLWANRMTTESMLPAAPMLDEAGFKKVHIMSASCFESCLMYLYEDPWERMRLLCSRMPHTEIMVLIRSRHTFGWDRYPNDVIELLFKCLKRIGIGWVLIFDGLNDIRNMEWQCRIARGVGLKAAPAITFAESPVHTDAYYADKASKLVEIGVDSICLGDASGLLTPQRTQTLIPAVRQAIGDKTLLEFSAHSGTGLSSGCYREALKAGVDSICTTSLPLSYGNSIPSTIEVIQMAQGQGLKIGLDRDLVSRIDDYFYWVAYREKRATGKPVRFDPVAYHKYAGHQIPGGMMSHLVSQLRDLGLEHRLPEVLEEAARVREELGWPVMVTPFSQFVGVQAVFNVVQGERYLTIPAELSLYARGYYGELAAPIAPNVLDRILSKGDSEPMDPLENIHEPMVGRFIKEKGPFRSDEDLLMSLFNTPQTLEKYFKNKKTIHTEAVMGTPLSCLIRELASRRDVRRVAIQKDRLRLDVRY